MRAGPDAGVRYWAATGLLIRACDSGTADADRKELVKAARGMLNDSSAYVRAVAAETVARFGEPNDRTTAIRALVDLSSADRHNLFVAVQALNSLDWTAPSRAEIGDGLKGLATSDKRFGQRYQNYLPRLAERIESILRD